MFATEILRIGVVKFLWKIALLLSQSWLGVLKKLKLNYESREG